MGTQQCVIPGVIILAEAAVELKDMTGQDVFGVCQCLTSPIEYENEGFTIKVQPSKHFKWVVSIMQCPRWEQRMLSFY